MTTEEALIADDLSTSPQSDAKVLYARDFHIRFYFNGLRSRIRYRENCILANIQYLGAIFELDFLS
jgi:hypothetical protein